MLLNAVPPVRACGPGITEPLYVFEESPDLPFHEFTNGNIGIVRPSFGRKTLFIAYRHLNGNAFTPDEQKDLIDALKGTAPEINGAAAVKAWVEARKEFLKEEEQKPPEIYTERSWGSYDFFPNCNKNAFEVALQTLKDRSASYGAEDPNVRTWLATQDAVFKNCSGPAQIPMQLGAENPAWLRKDRDYQIAAAHFYSLNFDEARARFENIAADADSPWQPIAGYLVARTLIRQGTLGNDEKRKREFLEQAESRLQTLVMSGGKYADASKKLLALVKYHIHPAERVVELGQTLSNGNNENLRQDLIDYTWLLDKLETEIGMADAERKQPEVSPDPQPPYAPFISQEAKDRFERVQRGETIELTTFEKAADGNQDYGRGITIEFKPDSSEAHILDVFRQQLGRELTFEQTKDLKRAREIALQQRLWRISPNRKWDFGGLSQHEGCYYDCTKFNFDLVPDFMRSDDLSDWILTLQIEDSRAYGHAFKKWRETGSAAWMLTALVKAQTSSPRLATLMQAAEKVTRDNPGFPTIAFHLIRLQAAMGQTDQARTLLDEIMSSKLGELPVSAQNQFLEQRMHLAGGLDEFLKSAQRKPVAFFFYDSMGKFSELLERAKRDWSVSSRQTKEEHERAVEEIYKDFLPWDNRLGFDSQTIDILNWHFSVPLLVEAARNPNVPDYLQRSFVLTAWTRALVLNNDEVALKIAPEVVRVEPQMGAVIEAYLKSRTAQDRRTAALYVLLKFPSLSPYMKGGLTNFYTTEQMDYYFEESWWCKPEDTEYLDGKEAPKVVAKPKFLTAAQLETARQEFTALAAITDAKTYLGKQVIEWAKTSPDDPRLPEALFIAAQANRSYKYGCSGWEYDEEIRREAETILRRRYPDTPWIAKLTQPDN